MLFGQDSAAKPEEILPLLLPPIDEVSVNYLVEQYLPKVKMNPQQTSRWVGRAGFVVDHLISECIRGIESAVGQNSKDDPVKLAQVCSCSWFSHENFC